ncbi:MAG: hypothetical protein M3Z37_10020 [Candidatus Eremiobacteraeota bacterium]|nr:hypothetical protein [Candidatus Eremiobacteraeota bacterium]
MIARSAQAAQYVAIDVPGAFGVRLPLGIWTCDDESFTLLFQEWGQRTARLAHVPDGTQVSCIGPLGNVFELPQWGERATIVAGGLGIVPFWLLARDLRRAGVPTTIILGARSKPLLVGTQQLETYAHDLQICTDDGSAGFRGNVLQRLEQLHDPGVIYGCGPPGMLRSLCQQAEERGLECQVSLEENFACSLGTCWGCVVPVRRGCAQGTNYPRAAGEPRDHDLARVCSDGTVFRAADLRWPRR